jgi:formylglycine-generating enzyme required for sulfatase activity
MSRIGLVVLGWFVFALTSSMLWAAEGRPHAKPKPATELVTPREVKALRLAIEDMKATFKDAYAKADPYLNRLAAIERNPGDRESFEALKSEALLSNPLLNDLQILLVKRMAKRKTGGNPMRGMGNLGFPENHLCYSSARRDGYDNEVCMLSPARPDGKLKTLYRPPKGRFVGDVELHWDAQRLLFTQSDRTNWKVWEMEVDGRGVRRVSKTPNDVDCFDACYLPDGRIVFGSNAPWQCVPCWHGVQGKFVANLYQMKADGSEMRRLCFDQDHDLHAVVINSGQVIFNRWDYTGINRLFLRQLMVMNPDGTGQRSLYGTNTTWPNALYFPRELPGGGKILCILGGYHGACRTGHLVLLDLKRGDRGSASVVQRMSGKGLPLEVKYMDRLVEKEWPKFLTPFPLSDKYFLVTGWMSPDSYTMGVYLADVFDNMTLIHQVKDAMLVEPIPVRARPLPPVLPDRVELSKKDATVYVNDVYAGPGLSGVPRGAIKRIRVFGYHFGYVNLAGNDVIGLSGPWEVMRIIGTTTVEADGSAVFRAPANTPLAFQMLDEDGKAVQLMRSWVTFMPGEKASCVGCHEPSTMAAGPHYAAAARRKPRELEPWYGPPRGFDFAREIQPLLNRHCVSCHDGRKGRPDLRPRDRVKDYRGARPGHWNYKRMHQTHKKLFKNNVPFTPAYEALLPYIRRVSIADDVALLTPGEYHADTSELFQLLQKGHHGVTLDREAYDRLATWIDLNGPCHGTWNAVFDMPVPGNPHERRMELNRLYSGLEEDYERDPELPEYDQSAVKPEPVPPAKAVSLDGWPFKVEARPEEQTLELGGHVKLNMVRIPAGAFVMGDARGQLDEQPLAAVKITKPFWMGVCEVDNEQYRSFDSTHDSHYYWRRHAERGDSRGMTLNDPRQPALRVSWQQAMEFCAWLSKKTGRRVTLPTEAQWEYACRAGRDTALHVGGLDADFSKCANMADRSFATKGYKVDGVFRIGGDCDYMVAEGVQFAERRWDDGAVVTAPIGGRKPNAFGLEDMHGNVAEWTRSVYRPYPYRDDDGRNAPDAKGEKVVRGGSFLDRPARCRSGFRLSYPPWQRVHNVGFRIVVEE